MQRFCTEQKLSFASVTAFADGGAGAEALADRVVEAAARGHTSHPLYPPGTPAEEILGRVIREIYGGQGFELSDAARSDLSQLRHDGEADGPICIAKTPLSLSADASRRGRPRDFTVAIRRLARWPGAGFTVAIAGSIMTMPGLPANPSASSIEFSDDGTIRGLH